MPRHAPDSELSPTDSGSAEDRNPDGGALRETAEPESGKEVRPSSAWLRAMRATPGLLWEMMQEFMRDGAPQMAAALSFYTIISLPPLLVLLMLIVGSVLDPETVRSLVAEQVGTLLGSQGAAQFENLIRNVSRPDLGSLTAVLGGLGLLFGATAGFAQLQGALNRVWSVAPDPTRGDIRNFLLKRVASFAMILSIGFLLLVSLVVSTILGAFADVLADHAPRWLTAQVMQTVDTVLSVAGISVLFAAIFHYVPDARVRWRDALAGGFFTALLFTVGKWGIGVYLGRSDLGDAYGAAGSLALALLWIYYSSMVLFIGAEFTEALARRLGQPIVPRTGAARVTREKTRYLPD